MPSLRKSEVHTGADPHRPGLNRLRELAKAGQMDVILIYALDRFMRDATQAVIVEDYLARAGAVIECMDLPDESAGLAYRATKSMLRDWAEEEGRRIRERTARGRRDSVKNGSVLAGRRPPYGYRLERQDDGRFVLVVEESEARIVRQIFHWYTVEGKTFYRIAETLTAMGVPTRADTSGLPRKSPAGRWSSSSVRDVVARAEVYATGRWYYGKRRPGRPKEGETQRWVQNPRDHWIGVDCPTLIDETTWHIADERRAQNKAMARRNTKYPYLLGRRVWCGNCGLKAHGHHHSWRPGAEHLYYVCPAGVFERRDLARKCDMPMFRADVVDATVWAWIKDLLLNPENMARRLERERSERERELQPLKERLTIVDNLLSDNRQKMARLLDLYLAGDFDKEVLAERRMQLEKTVMRLEEERANLTAMLAARDLTAEQVQTIQDLAADMRIALGQADPTNFDERRKIVDLLDVRARLAVEEGEKVVYASCVLDRARLPQVVLCQTGPANR